MPLRVSADECSINIMRPAAVTHPAKEHDFADAAAKPWWHTDQAPSRSGMHCIQGFLTLTPVGADAGAD